MRLDEKLDSGPIITLQKIVIEDDDNYENVYKKIVFFGKKILRDAIFKIINDEVNYVYQDERFVTYAEKIKKMKHKLIGRKMLMKLIKKLRPLVLNLGLGQLFEIQTRELKSLKPT